MPMHFSAVARARATLLTSLSFLVALAGVAVVAPAPAARAAVPAFACDAVYSVSADGAVSRLNTSTGAVTANGAFGQTGDRVNALALPGGGGRYIWAFNRDTARVLRLDSQGAGSGSVTTFATTMGSGDADSVVAGAIDPSTGRYYIASSGSSWKVFAFDTETGAYLGQVATMTGSGLGGNGDLAVDSFGNGYVVSNTGSTAGGTVSRVNLATGSSTLVVTKLADTPSGKGQYASVAIDGDGSIVIGAIGGSANTVTRLNPTTGAQLSTTTTTVQPADFASCSVPSTATTRANLPDGRYAPGDQFTVSVTGGGITTGNTGTTTGTDTGVQGAPEEMGGPVLTTRGTTYTITQAAAGTTNLADYTTTWSCAQPPGGATIASGTGQSGTFTTPAGTASDVVCTFTNLPKRPSVDLVKTASALNDLDGNGPDVGDTVVYGYTVTNTGATPLSSVGVVDVKAGTITCAKTSLAVGEATTCTSRTYTLTQADVDAGQVVAPATASGTSPTGAVVTDTESTTTPVARTARIAVDQTASSVADTNASGAQDAGDTVTYGHVVTNTGNVTLTGVAVTDPTLGAITCPKTVLVPGESMTCTPKARALTQADVNAGSVATTATATGTPPSGVTPSPVTATDSTTVVLTRAPAIDLTLTGSAVVDDDGNGIDPGDTVTYSFVVKNTGNVVLDPTSVTSTRLGAVTCPAGPLAPGASVTCTQRTTTITQADIDAGQVTVSATASGTAPGGAVVTDPDAVTTPLAQDPSVLTTKTASTVADTNTSGKQDVGDRITYTFTVKNSGNVTLSAVGVTDARIGTVTCPTGPLAPGAIATCTAPAYVLTQADVDAGKVVNTATGRGTSPKGVVVTDDDTVTTPVVASPSIALDKTASTIADTNGNGLQDAGDTITYGFVVTNTGNVTLSPVTVVDQTVGTVTCPATPLPPGQSVTCTPRNHVLTQADVNAGAVAGTATATGKPPVGATVTASDATATPITATPRIDLTKTASAVADTDGNGTDVGDRITYTFTVRNTGNVPLDPVTVTDTTVGPVTCPAGPLAPGATRACSTAVHTLTQADIDAGLVSGTATATGTSAGGTQVFDAESTTTPLTRTPSVRLDKTAGAITDLDGNGPDVGDTITYGFSVTNTGNVTLTGLTVSDPKVGAVTCPTSPLAPGATLSCTPKTYTVTQDDVNAGRVDNTATVEATAPGGVTVTDSDTATSPITPGPAVEIDQTVSAIDDVDGNGPDAGDTVTYGYTVTNLGNVTLSDVVVTDPRFGSITCPSGPLAPRASITCTPRTFTLTQAHVDAGTLPGNASVVATPPSGPEVTDTDSVVTTIPARPSVLLDKTAGPVVDVDGNGPDAGDTITYGFTVTNTGNVTLDPVAVSDTLLGAVTCPAGPLAPGTTRTCTAATYTLTQADVDAGSVGSPATATGRPPVGAAVTSTDATATPVAGRGAIELTKTASPIDDVDGNGPDAGDLVTYTVTVRNTGAVTLSDVTVTDPLLGTFTCPTGPLTPGASRTCTPVVLSLTQAQVDAGTVGSPATATGKDPVGDPVTDTDATATAIPASARIGLDKTASAIGDVDGNGPDAGDRITYGFVVTNTGNRTLSDVTVVDTLLGPVTCPAGPLAPGATRTCTPIAYTLTQDDVEAGSVGSPATATGTSGATTVTATDTTTTPVAAGPAVAIDKSASAIDDLDGDGPDVGDTITYSFTVTNTGAVRLSQVQVLDPKVGPVSCPPTTLSPGRSLTCTPRAYTLTQADVDAGRVDNTATVRATTGTGTQVSGTDTVGVPVPEAPAITVDLSAAPVVDLDDNGPDAGDTIDYTITVANAGNVTLTGVTVKDPHLGPITCPRTVLAPGATMTCTVVTHTIRPAEEAAGTVASTATATGTSPRGTRVSDDDTETTAVPVRTVDLRIDKSADRAEAAPGERVRYTLAVTNDGPSAADAVVVEDRLPSAVSFVDADAPCGHTAGTVRCELGTLPAGATRSVVVTVEVREPVTGAALVQHDLDVQKVEAQVDLEPGQTRSVAVQCAPGYVVTDGSGRVDHVDQGTGTLASVRVTESYASGERTWTATAVNDATGRAQAKVFAVCVEAETEVAGAGTVAGAHSHPLVLSPVVTRTVPVLAGRTELTLDCGAGTVPVVPGHRLAGAATQGAVLTSYPAPGEGWTFAVDSATGGGTLSADVRCLDTRTGDAQPGGGHAHDLDLAEVRRAVVVPAGELVEVDLSCADDAKGVVAGWDLDPGLVDLGNDPRPKIRVFKLWNPTAQPLEADLFLLCLGSRTRPGDSSDTIVNTARVSTGTRDTTPGNDTDSAVVTRVEAATTPAPRPVATPASPRVTVAGRAVVTTVRCSAGTAACAGTATLVAARTQRIDGRTVRKGAVLARATYRVVSGKVATVRLRSTALGATTLRSTGLRKATLRVGSTSRAVSIRR